MTAWDAGVGSGLLRLAAGATILGRRRQLTDVVAGAPGDRVVAAMFAYFGVRDVALGMATLAATRPGGDVARMLRLQALADATDAGIVVAVHRTGHLGRVRALGAGAVAMASALGGLVASVAVTRGATADAGANA